MKKLLTLALTILLGCAMVLPVMANAFPDVPENHWAYKAVEELYAVGLVIGYPDGTFGGQRALTRYEYAQIVARLYERLQEIAAENSAQADKALSAAMTAQEMAQQAQLAIEKHLTEKQPDGSYEEIAKQARDLSVLVESLRDEFSAELAELDDRVTVVEDKVAKLETDVAELKRSRFNVSGTFETTLEDVNVNGTNLLVDDNGTPAEPTDDVFGAYIDPYNTDFDDDDFTWSDHKDSDDVYQDGVTLQSALTLNLGLVPAEGVDLNAKVKLKDTFGGSDSNQPLSLQDLSLEATSDGLIRRAYYGDLAATDAFAGYSRFIKTRSELITDKEVDEVEGAQVDMANGKLAGQFSVLGNETDGQYYILSRGEYAFAPAITVGGSVIKSANTADPANDDVADNRYGLYAKGNVATVDYLLGYYSGENLAAEDATALELALAKSFGLVDVSLDYTSDYDEKAYTLVAAQTGEDFALDSIPLSVSGEFGTASEADEAHYKVGVKVVDYKLGILKLGGGYEMVAKDMDDNDFEVAAWDDTDVDYGKFSLNAGFDYSIGSVKFTPGLEWYTKDVTENDGATPDHTDTRTTVKLGFAAPAFTRGTLAGAFKYITDEAKAVESNATGLNATLSYPVGGVNLTFGGEWLDYQEDVGFKYGDFDYLVIKSGVKFDF